MPKTIPSAKAPDQLPVQARLRLEHAGKWIAWRDDFAGVVTAGDSHEAVREAARRAGEPRAAIEWVPPVPQRSLDPGP